MFILHFIVNQKISPVAALSINPKMSPLMKASFQRADIFGFTDFVGDLFSYYFSMQKMQVVDC